MSEIKLTKAQRLLAIDDFIRWVEHMANVARAHGDEETVKHCAHSHSTAETYQMYELGEFAGGECASEAQLEEYRAYRGNLETLCVEQDAINTADSLDAKRYRWLTGGLVDTYSLFVEAEDKAQLDAAIDESMAQNKRGE